MEMPPRLSEKTSATKRYLMCFTLHCSVSFYIVVYVIKLQNMMYSRVLRISNVKDYFYLYSTVYTTEADQCGLQNIIKQAYIKQREKRENF